MTYDGFFYFTSKEDSYRIYRGKLGTDNASCIITEAGCQNLQMSKNKLYFRKDKSKKGDEFNRNDVVQMDLDGKNPMKIETNADAFHVCGERMIIMKDHELTLHIGKSVKPFPIPESYALACINAVYTNSVLIDTQLAILSKPKVYLIN